MAALYDCLVEIQRQVQALDLPGIPPGNVVLCQVPAVEIARMNSRHLPAVVIAPFGAETVTATPLPTAAARAARREASSSGEGAGNFQR